MAKILIVDDDKNIREVLRLYLSHDGHELFFAEDGSRALDLFEEARPDLVILDIMLPVINGYEVIRLLRTKSDVPVIMLTARDAVEDRIEGLDSGADDYVVKPFDPKEVAARVRAQLRRKSEKSHEILSIGNTIIDINRMTVTLNGNQVDLKPKEIQLLIYLFRNKGLALSREKILEDVWGYDYAGETRTVDVHVNRLREKFKDEERYWRIKTLWSMGYRLEYEK
ncbi:MAG: response regulator transcription factor [Thermoanaerobacteraceae bacterium]|nr:response regulator transcription factor [Thermoanaerobacteraceae bacterium]